MMCDDKVTNIYRTTLEEKVKETENGMEACSSLQYSNGRSIDLSPQRIAWVKTLFSFGMSLLTSVHF